MRSRARLSGKEVVGKARRRTRGSASRSPSHALLDLQQSAGNAAVARLVQRAPTAGPSEDDRWGEGKVAHDLEARILSVSIKGGRTHILIASGTDQGVRVGMEGYAIDPTGAAHSFSIEDAAGRTSDAPVNLTLDEAERTDKVVINPASMPQTARGKNVRARILAVSIEGGMTKITIGGGPQQGIQVGMKGSIVGDDGKPYKDFEIADADGRWSHAFVQATPDEIRVHDHVVVNP